MLFSESQYIDTKESFKWNAPNPPAAIALAWCTTTSTALDFEHNNQQCSGLTCTTTSNALDFVTNNSNALAWSPTTAMLWLGAQQQQCSDFVRNNSNALTSCSTTRNALDFVLNKQKCSGVVRNNTNALDFRAQQTAMLLTFVHNKKQQCS